jgi:hypothetical protein
MAWLGIVRQGCSLGAGCLSHTSPAYPDHKGRHVSWELHIISAYQLYITIIVLIIIVITMIMILMMIMMIIVIVIVIVIMIMILIIITTYRAQSED